MDFITDLPPSQGFDAIITVVDRFTKMAHFLPCVKSINSQETTNIIMREVFRHHGLPEDIISDRGPQFIAHFWRHLCEGLKISCKLSSAYPPETNGQTERTNQILEQYLRCFISYQEDDWSQILHLEEFAYNNTVDSSTKVTPFYAYTSNHPRWCLLEIPVISPNPSAALYLQWLQQIQVELSSHL